MTDCDQPRSKQAQIIEAAVKEFQEKGFDAARMDCVSARAGVSKRTVYKYFESKENLFRAILDVLSDRFSGMQDMRYDPARPLREQLVALGRAEGALLITPDVMAMARMLISETLRSPEMARTAQGRMDKTGAFVAMLRAAQEDGRIDAEDPDEAAREFMALIKAKAFWPMIFGAPLLTCAEMERVVDSSVDMILSRYGVSEDPG